MTSIIKIAAILFGGLALACGVSACQAPPLWERDDPAVVLKGFLQSAEAQRTDLVWNYLGQNTRGKLQQKVDTFNQRFEGVMTRHPEDMLRFGHVISSTREYKKIELIQSDESVATVRIVRHDESGLDIEMHHEDGRWTIELPI